MTNTLPGSPDTVPAQMDYSKTLNVPKPDVKNPDGLDINPDSNFPRFMRRLRFHALA